MSGLFGVCERFSKDSSVFEALGSVDELVSLLGVCFAKAVNDQNPISSVVRAIQEDLFVIQAQLAGADKKIGAGHVLRLEREIAEIEKRLAPIVSFVIPGATELSALLDYARAVARRTERVVVRANSEHPVAPDALRYLNRLSSLLYALARLVAQESGEGERVPAY